MKRSKDKENKGKRKIWKILLVILIVIIGISLVCFIISLINKNKMSKNDEKLLNAIQALEKERLSYVFIEINPKLAVTIKNNVVNNVACLNDDCMKIIDKIDVREKNLSNVIEVIYNVSKDNGFNVDDGVLVKWDGSQDLYLKDLKYVKTEVIDSEKQNELLKDVINNDIKNKNEVENYNVKLLEEYKKDADYGKIYDCSIVDKELDCRIKKNLIVNINGDGTATPKSLAEFTKILPNLEGLARVFKKFGFEVENYKELGIIDNPFAYVYFKNIKFLVISNGKTTDTIKFEGTKDCEYYTFDMVDINLAKLNNLKIRYVNEDFLHVGDETEYVNEDLCGKKICKKNVYKSHTYCNKETNLIEDNGRTIYTICDTNKKNCKEVIEEEYKLYDQNYGYVLDYPICKFGSDGWLDKKFYSGKEGVCREEGNNQLWPYSFDD